MGSDISGLYRMKLKERREEIKKALGLDDLDGIPPPNPEVIEGMIENVIGGFTLPLGIATNFLVNGREHLVPMVIEEASVVAAASKGAGMARKRGGFHARVLGRAMIGQVQLVDVPDIKEAIRRIRDGKGRLLSIANSKDPVLVEAGGGAKDIEIRVVDSSKGKFLVVHLMVDCGDAMGANAVNTMAEHISPELQSLSGGKALLRILSNMAVGRLVVSKAVFPKEDLGGPDGVDRIMKAHALAEVDPFRAATHNKGIMNGVSAVVLATGNDTRAVEAGAHSFAASAGSYSPLTRFRVGPNGDLEGEIELPLPVGIVGGATKVHPTAKACIRLLGVRTASELAEVIASVGLAQNMAALRALALEGIQKGHMRLHARNLAIQAGATPEEAERIIKGILKEDNINASKVAALLKEMRDARGDRPQEKQ